MKILKYLLFLLLILIIGAAMYTAVQPSTFEVSRALIINTSPRVIQDYLQKPEQWSRWAPWIKGDSLTKYSITEKDSLTEISWNGPQSGSGTMTQLPYTQDSIVQQLGLREPSELDVTLHYKLIPMENSTSVIARVNGNLTFMEKARALFGRSREQQLGPLTEKGLEQLQAAIAKDLSSYNLEVKGLTEYGSGYYMFKVQVTKDTQLNASIAKLIPEIQQYMKARSIDQDGAPFTLFQQWNSDSENRLIAVAIPVREMITVQDTEGILCEKMNGGTYFKATLTGKPEYLTEAWSMTEKKLREMQLEKDSVRFPFEVYVKNASSEYNPAHYVTDIFIPVIVKPAEEEQILQNP